jgi:uncharacterized membrane protein
MNLVITVAYVVALLFYATWFGIAAYMLIAPCYDKLSGPTFIEWFQKIDPYMKVRAPQMMLAQLAVTLVLLLLMHDRSASPEFWLTALALVTTAATMGIAIRGNVPLNRQMDHWSHSHPPDGWEQTRDRWLGYHHLRSIAEIAGFVALLVSALLYSSGG